jgi:hypothetical protein
MKCNAVSWCSLCKKNQSSSNHPALSAKNLSHPDMECLILKSLSERWNEFQETQVAYEEAALVSRLIVMSNNMMMNSSSIMTSSSSSSELQLALQTLESNSDAGGVERGKEGRRTAAALLSNIYFSSANLSIPPTECERLLAMLLTNTFMVCMKTKSRKSLPYALALYPSASFFNHSCFPNAARLHPLGSSKGKCLELIIIALHDLNPGEEICIRYGTPITEVQGSYGFKCDCIGCQGSSNGDYSLDDEVTSPFSCPVGVECGGLLCPLVDQDASSFQCNTCEKIFILTELSPRRKQRLSKMINHDEISGSATVVLHPEEVNNINSNSNNGVVEFVVEKIVL